MRRCLTLLRQGGSCYTDPTKEFQALKRLTVGSSQNKAGVTDDETTLTVSSRAIYDTIFGIKSPVKSSAELIPSLRKGPLAITRLLNRWSKEPANRVYFKVTPAGLNSHSEVLQFTLTKIVR